MSFERLRTSLADRYRIERVVQEGCALGGEEFLHRDEFTAGRTFRSGMMGADVRPRGGAASPLPVAPSGRPAPAFRRFP